jgi:hypothetical protein
MNQNQVIDLLTAVAASDRRTVGEADVTIWQEVLGTMQLDDCLKALVTFRRESPGVWLEPGHIVKLVRASVLQRHEEDQLTIEEQRRIAQYTHEQKMFAGLTPEQKARAFIAPDGTLVVPADPKVRERCMDEIRAVLAKPGARFGMSPTGTRLSAPAL